MLGAAGLVLVATVLLARPVSAVHLFPVTPGFDPVGHDCAQNLVAAPAESGAAVDVAGFTFVDGDSRAATTTIEAGQAVTWTWLADHCHSVTFADGRGTQGADGFMPEQPELVRVGDGGDSFTLTFDTPGTYEYSCVHHAAVGMSGVVEVAAAAQEDGDAGGGSGDGGGETAAQPRPAAAPELPATGAGPVSGYALGASGAVVLVVALLRRALLT